jgi:hypothetical protein
VTSTSNQRSTVVVAKRFRVLSDGCTAASVHWSGLFRSGSFVLTCHLWLSARAPSKLHAAKQVSLKARLRSYGLAGVAAYGLLNTVYYITAFLFFWTHVAKVPRGKVFVAYVKNVQETSSSTSSICHHQHVSIIPVQLS